jgi:hypothetical protein
MLRAIPLLLLVVSCASPKPPSLAQAPGSAAPAAADEPTNAAPRAPHDEAPATAIPDTPAGRTLEAWLDAFNSGDPELIQAYHASHEPSGSAEETLAFREQTGGFDLVGIDKSERLKIEFRVAERAGPTVAVGNLEVKDSDPVVVLKLGLRAIPPGMTAADMDVKVDAATRTRVIDGVVAKLNEAYVFAKTAKKMGAALRAHQRKGKYDAITDGHTFAALLTEHLQAVSRDKHLHVLSVPAVLPKGDLKPDPAQAAQRRADLKRNNCGFQKAERLPSNIGYLKFNIFADPAICGPTAISAMSFLGNVDAVIFDLRDNGGGEPEMIALISTYLFDQPTHLNDLYSRKDNETTQYWTLPYVPGKRLSGKPAFVLTSKRTFSGAEEFSYNLKNLKRATIIGETTGGGAHPTSGHRLADHFMILVPDARAINPITKTNWEGKGVEPDVKVPAAEALELAKKMAAEQIRKSQLDR